MWAPGPWVLSRVAVQPAAMLSLSVLVPVYNEEHLVAESLGRLEVLEKSPHLDAIQVIVVDDCSGDGTPEVLRGLAADRGIRVGPSASTEGGPYAAGGKGKTRWELHRHARNG